MAFQNNHHVSELDHEQRRYLSNENICIQLEQKLLQQGPAKQSNPANLNPSPAGFQVGQNNGTKVS